VERVVSVGGYYTSNPGGVASQNQALNGFWWEAEEGCAHERVLPLFRRLIEQDKIRRDNVLRLMRMSGNYSHTGLGRSQEMDPSRLRYNLIAQATGTLKAEITINEPKAAIVPTQAGSGDWEGERALHRSADARCEVVGAHRADVRAGRARYGHRPCVHLRGHHEG
jgi:hypothetical protein